MRQHYVSRKVAENFLTRREWERDPLDVMQKDRLPAPRSLLRFLGTANAK